MAAPGDTRTNRVKTYDDALAYVREVKIALGPRSLDFLIHLDNYMQDRIDALTFSTEIIKLLEDHSHLVPAIPAAIAVMEDLDKIALDQIRAVLGPDLFPVIKRSSQEIGSSSAFQMGSISVPGVSPLGISNALDQGSSDGMEFLNSSENPFNRAHMQLTTPGNAGDLLQQQMNSQLMELMSGRGNFQMGSTSVPGVNPSDNASGLLSNLPRQASSRAMEFLNSFENPFYRAHMQLTTPGNAGDLLQQQMNSQLMELMSGRGNFQMGSTSVPGVNPSDNASGLLSNLPRQASSRAMEFLNSFENPFYRAHMQLTTPGNAGDLLQQQMNSQLMELMSGWGNFQMGLTSVPGVNPSDNASGLLSNLPRQASNRAMEFLNSFENPFYRAHMQLTTPGNAGDLLQQQMNSQLMELMSGRGNFQMCSTSVPGVNPSDNASGLLSNLPRQASSRAMEFLNSFENPFYRAHMQLTTPGNAGDLLQQQMNSQLMELMSGRGNFQMCSTSFPGVNPSDNASGLLSNLPRQASNSAMEFLNSLENQLMGPMSGHDNLGSDQKNLGLASNFGMGIRPDSTSVAVQHNMSDPLQFFNAMANMGPFKFWGTNFNLNPQTELQPRQWRQQQQQQWLQLQQQQQQQQLQLQQQMNLGSASNVGMWICPHCSMSVALQQNISHPLQLNAMTNMSLPSISGTNFHLNPLKQLQLQHQQQQQQLQQLQQLQQQQLQQWLQELHLSIFKNSVCEAIGPEKFLELIRLLQAYQSKIDSETVNEEVNQLLQGHNEVLPAILRMIAISRY